MTTVLGKRKSRASVTPKAAAPAAKPTISEEEAREIFRRHFEAQFAPLSDNTTKQAAGKKSNGKSREKVKKSDEAEDEDVEDMRSSDEDDDDDDDAQEGDWDGLSGSDDENDEDDRDDEPEEANKIEVVDYTQSNTPKANPLAAALARREAKAYLSSKVPLASVGGSDTGTTTKTKQKTKTPTEEDSADLVRNDLALQRLLSESHLFNPTNRSGSLIGSTVNTEHSGRNRHLATDMRVAALSGGGGGKGAASIYKQDKMPMSHRKGIEGARRDRESKRRREAKENGIILEKESSGKKSSVGGGGGGGRRRERAVDAPAVGKMRGGMLRLSKRDVAEINGPVRSGGKMKKRRR
ncbi:hypothetical protein PFICI_05258 [Pestalotiopsis fici W106-1]|uniref:Protein FAF1 n=1 Tax=Pestalotiopsis fici (strain W106-1 / CGMCC3.15140) TaxID=1229662 RepID=W3XD92_PESFW|nr:uncharacterized protein PFICI_05258 [Pestalotiopsis fici W106-1]ETS83382.1 hypothetical protein PFICI_05258 [Pestalotiopsis fici W106-1]